MNFFKNTKRLIKLIVFTCLVGAFFYLASLIMQYVANLGETLKGKKATITYNPFKSFYELFSTRYGLIAVIVLGSIIAVCLMYKLYRKLITKNGEKARDGSYLYSQKGTYGTAKPLAVKEIYSTFAVVKSPYKSNGTLLGYYDDKIVYLTYEAKYNRNVMVIGGPGSGKSACYVSNQIMQTFLDSEKNPHSLIITDTKGELYSRFSLMAKKYGYTVRILNLVDIIKSDGWNALASLGESDEMVDIFAQTIIKNTSGEKAAEGYFENLCLNLLKALTLYELEISKEEHREPSFTGLLSHLEKIKDEGQREAINDAIMDVNNDQFERARIPWGYFMIEPQRVPNTIISLGTRLNVLQSKTVKNLLEHNDIDLELPGKQKCCYFIKISDQDETYAFLSSLFFSFCFKKLTVLADSNMSQELDVPVTFLLDEFCNLGVITDIEKKFSTLRGRGIGIHAIIQSIPQIMNRYPKGVWEEIISDCDTQLFLGCTDMTTAEWISKKTGEATIGVESNKTTLGSFEAASSTTSVGRRVVYTANEILTLDRNNELIFLSGKNVFQAKKFFFKNHPLAKEIQPQNATEHIPAYQRSSDETSRYSEAKEKEKEEGWNYNDNYEDDEVEKEKKTNKKNKTNPKPSNNSPYNSKNIDSHINF